MPLCTGGTVADALLNKQSAASLRTVLAAKLPGALHAARASTLRPQRSAVYFSSVATLLGNAGQTNYAAANAALETLASAQQSQVLSCSSSWLLFLAALQEATDAGNLHLCCAGGACMRHPVGRLGWRWHGCCSGPGSPA